MLKAEIFPLGDMAVNAVAVTDDDAKKLWIFDAPDDVGKIVSHYSAMTFEALFLTHGHFDHILGFGELPSTQVFAAEGDKNFLQNPSVMRDWTDEATATRFRPVTVSRWISVSEVLNVNGLRVDVRLSPGHSKGGVVYYLPDLKLAMVGDTLFRRGVGRTDFGGGSMEELVQSIRRQIFTLPDDTRLIPGHGPETTVGYEKRNNPYARIG